MTSSTLSGVQIPREHRPGEMDMHYPMAHLGYMGRSDDPRLKGFGPTILYDVALRVKEVGKHVGVCGVWLEAENKEIEDWYARWGFHYLVEDPRRAARPRKRMFAAVEPLIDAVRNELSDRFFL